MSPVFDASIADALIALRKWTTSARCAATMTEFSMSIYDYESIKGGVKPSRLGSKQRSIDVALPAAAACGRSNIDSVSSGGLDTNL